MVTASVYILDVKVLTRGAGVVCCVTPEGSVHLFAVFWKPLVCTRSGKNFWHTTGVEGARTASATQ